MSHLIRVHLLTAAVLIAAPCQAQTNILRNSSFETGGLAGWSSFGGNIFAERTNPSAIVPRTGSTLVKMFGQFTGQANATGIYQTFATTPGENFILDCWSRHWGGDPILGSGPPNDNSMAMKIAFFDAADVEIGAVESTILDGNSPTDVWIDNIPIIATAPAGTASVQALIMFLQPGVAPGSGQVDDIYFNGAPDNPPYPGTGEDLVLTTGVGPGGPSGGNPNFVKTALVGDTFECNVVSPSGTFAGAEYILLAQPFTTGNPPGTAVLPSVYLVLTQPVYILVGTSMPLIGKPRIAPGTGSTTYYITPPGLAGNSAMLQALVLDPRTNNNFYAASDGYEIQFQ